MSEANFSDAMLRTGAKLFGENRELKAELQRKDDLIREAVELLKDMPWLTAGDAVAGNTAREKLQASLKATP